MGARRYDGTDKPTTFADVAGLEGVKNELQEIVEFLRDPAKFQRLGARVPKGVLLMGPPGTGKTLLAPRGRRRGRRALLFHQRLRVHPDVRGRGGGAGPRPVSNTAKESAPAILFIDEIDAVGRHRGAGIGGGHDEREQTLNQILSEMDGFTQTQSVIVMAATNRPDVLDPALLRPGRFDRHITVDRPSLKGRLAIFEVHTREVPLASDVKPGDVGGRNRRAHGRRHPQPGERSGPLGQPPRTRTASTCRTSTTPRDRVIMGRQAR